MKYSRKFLIYVLSLIILFPYISYAGNISATDNMAWGDKMGWVNFGATNGNLIVGDTTVTGYAWIPNYGWLNMNPSNGGVMNDGAGHLSGYAWSEALGFIDFSGVDIDPASGEFSGRTASTTLSGVINFSCSNCKVITSWRSASSTPPTTPTTTPTTTPETVPTSSSNSSTHSTSPNVTVDNTNPSADIANGENNPLDIDNVSNYNPIPTIEKWDIFPTNESEILALPPLQKDFMDLVKKFPDLVDTLKEAGVTKISDLDNLTGATFDMPYIPEITKLPPNIFLASVGSMNMSSAIEISDKGKIVQKIETPANRHLTLTMRLESEVQTMTGYIILISNIQNVREEVPAKSILASVALASTSPVSPKIANNKIISTFKYSDKDNDDIYTADIIMPTDEGRYEIVTNINYSDKNIGTKEMKMIADVTPSGIVYEKGDVSKKPISHVKISLYNSNGILWNSGDSSQNNPQVTDDNGKYSYLVRAGEYYITAEAEGYELLKSDAFGVKDGKQINFNIELEKSGYSYRDLLDWKLIIIYIVIIMSVWNHWYEKRLLRK